MHKIPSKDVIGNMSQIIIKWIIRYLVYFNHIILYILWYIKIKPNTEIIFSFYKYNLWYILTTK